LDNECDDRSEHGCIERREVDFIEHFQIAVPGRIPMEHIRAIETDLDRLYKHGDIDKTLE